MTKLRNSIKDDEILQGLNILDKYQDLDSCIKAEGDKVYVGKTETIVEVLDYQKLINLGFGVDAALITDTASGDKYYCYSCYLKHVREPWQFQTFKTG